MGLIKDILRFLFRDGITINLGGRRERESYTTSTRSTKTVDYLDEVYVKPAVKSAENIKKTVIALCDEKSYQFEKDVSVETLGTGHTSKYNFTFIIKDLKDELKAAVFIVPHNGEKNRHYYALKEACAAKNIPFIYFFEQMTNTEEYVKERINKVL